MLYNIASRNIYYPRCRSIYRGNLNTSTCGFSWISLQVHISSSLKGSMTAARSKIRTTYFLSTVIQQTTVSILCVLDVGLAGCVFLLSQSPAFLPANPIHPHLSLINFRFCLGFREGPALSISKLGQSSAYSESLLKVSTSSLPPDSTIRKNAWLIML